MENLNSGFELPLLSTFMSLKQSNSHLAIHILNLAAPNFIMKSVGQYYTEKVALVLVA